MPGKEREELTHFFAEHPDVGRRLREAAEHAKEAAAEVEEVVGQMASSEPPDRADFTGKVLSAPLAGFITVISSTANTFIQSSAAEIGRLIGKELEATEAAEPRRASSVSKSE